MMPLTNLNMCRSCQTGDHSKHVLNFIATNGKKTPLGLPIPHIQACECPTCPMTDTRASHPRNDNSQGDNQLNLITYTNEALRTAGTFPNKQLAICYWTLGICGEADELEDAYSNGNAIKEAGDVVWYCVVLANEIGIPLHTDQTSIMFRSVESTPTLRACQLAEVIKKHIGHGKELDTDAVRQILGDILSLAFEFAKEAGQATAEEVLEANIKKLRARYPEGFSYKDSKDRRDLA